MTTTVTNNQLISVKDQERIAETFKNLRESLERNGTFKALEALQERGAAIAKAHSAMFEGIKTSMPNFERIGAMAKEMIENMPRIERPIIPYVPERSYYLENYDEEAETEIIEPKETIVFDTENKVLKWNGQIIHSFMSAKFPRRLMELAFDEGYGYRVPMSAFGADYKSDDICDGVKNFRKLIKGKAKKHNIPLDTFGDFIVRKPSNYILISPVFMEG